MGLLNTCDKRRGPNAYYLRNAKKGRERWGIDVAFDHADVSAMKFRTEGKLLLR
jgi:hypothetical protein